MTADLKETNVTTVIFRNNEYDAPSFEDAALLAHRLITRYDAIRKQNPKRRRQTAIVVEADGTRHEHLGAFMVRI